MIHYIEKIRSHYNAYLKYQEEHRHYHTIQHLIQMFKDLENFKFLLNSEEIEELELVIIYHDVVYDIMRVSPSTDILSQYKIVRFFI